MPETDALTDRYDVRGHRMITLHDLVSKFQDKSDTSRAFLKRYWELIAAIDGPIKPKWKSF